MLGLLASTLAALSGPATLRAQQGAPGARSRARREVPPPGVIVTPDPKLQQPPATPPAVGGVWTQLNNLPPVAVDNCLLMTDATVLCHENAGSSWYRLTPSNTGSYQAGTWAFDSTMQSGYAPLYFASAVLADGRVIVEGGEYNCTPNCTANWGTQGSFYDPATKTWTPVNPPTINGTPWSRIGDAQSVVLADGTFMLADCCSGNAAYFNPATLTWTPVTGHQIDNYHDEENWTLLPDGRVLTVDAWPANSQLSEIYDPVTQKWSSAGNTPVLLTDNNRTNASYEQGPGVLRPNGTVYYFGANASGAGHTAIYDSTTGTWSAGPDYPGSDDAADAPATLLPNGNVLSQASPGIFGSPSHWYEVDYATGALTQVSSPNYSFSASSYYGQMLVLPTGQILQTEFSNDIRLYTPSGAPNPAWAPAITSVPSTVTAGSSYSISGTQFNGLSQGAAYGDDWQSATNYPLVRITNNATGHVVYAKTHNHSSMGVATGGLIVSTTFDVPATTETGASTIQVVANGIASAAVALNVQNSSAPAPFAKSAPANGTTGLGNSVNLSWGASAGVSNYEYCVDTTNDNLCSAAWTNAGTATSATVNGLAAGTTYYWQVRAVNGIGTTTANSGTWWSFATASLPAAFAKSAPASGATGQPTSVAISWAASGGATTYEYCVDTTNDNACGASWVSTAATSATVSGLSFGTSYYWQVRARNAAGTTDANGGTWWSFTTQPPPAPGAFAKTSPANGATRQSTNPTLSWGASTNAATYEYCVSTVNNSCSAWVSAGTATSVRRSGLASRTTYYWQVRAKNTTATTDANGGTWWSFTTK